MNIGYEGGYSINQLQVEKCFELRGLQMIPSNSPISNSSGITHVY
eukprot:UN22290